MKHIFPTSWPTHSFKEVAEVITGTTPLTSHPEYYGGSIPFIGPAELGRVESITQSPKSLSYDGAKQARLLPAEAVLVCCIGATIGKVGFSGTELATNQQINALVCDKDIVFPRYVFHYCRTLESLIRHQGASTTLPLLPKGRFQEIEIPVPTLEEQKRIAEILDRSQFLISKRQEAIAQLNILTQAIFIEMFGDPVINPKGWTIEKLGKLGTLDRGISKHRPRNAPELLGGIYPLVQTGDVANSGGYIRHYKNTYSEVGLRQSKMWKTGTLCITIAANIAKTGILTFDACFPDSIVGFLAKDFATIEFVRVWLSFIQKTLEETAPESAQKNINLGTLRDLSIPFPPLLLQKEFAQRVEAVEKLKATHRESLSELQALFASLQHRAFRGEL